jgi:mannitol/fructose-specific phosphotransferase system IIA component (Ntr-type)
MVNLVQLSELIAPERVVLLEARDKRDAIGQLAALVSKAAPEIGYDNLVETLIAREGIMSTGIGLGIAVPHARLANVDQPVLAVGVSRKGIDYESLDDKPAHIIVLIVVPAQCRSSICAFLPA